MSTVLLENLNTLLYYQNIYTVKAFWHEKILDT